MSSPSKPEHTDSRVDAAVSLEHASGSLGDCESLAHTRRCLPRGRDATTGSAESVRIKSVLLPLSETHHPFLDHVRDLAGSHVDIVP